MLLQQTDEAAPAVGMASLEPAPDIAPPQPSGAVPVAGQTKVSLLKATTKANRGKREETAAERMLKEEQELLRKITERKALQGVGELAKVSFFAWNVHLVPHIFRGFFCNACLQCY